MVTWNCFSSLYTLSCSHKFLDVNVWQCSEVLEFLQLSTDFACMRRTTGTPTCNVFLLLELLLTVWDIGFLQHELAPWIGVQDG